MKYPIESVFLGNEYFENFDIPEEDGEYLSNLSKINIFIGANNSGKSRFTRTLFEKEDLGYLFRSINTKEINCIIEDFKKELSEYHDQKRLDNYGGIQTEFLEKIKPIKFYDREFHLDKYLIRPLKVLQNIGGDKDLSMSSPMSSNRGRLGNDLNQIAVKYLTKLDEIVSDNSKEFEFEKIYIPILRGLRTIGIKNGDFSHEDVYTRRTLKDYFQGDVKFESRIYTGLRLYEDTKALLLGSTKDRERIRSFESFLSKNFFNEQTINIIPRQGDDVVHVLIGDRERPIYELGDGIQAIIILTYPLFFNQSKEMKVFIEEPEQYLHPGFQRVFLETLIKPEFNSFQYFITTHSNHFLDITLDIETISVYTFKGNIIDSEQKFIIENVENEDANILELLGVRNASVFLSNCTIWVEGITDRIYIRKYLEVLQKHTNGSKKFKEDTHYSFVEYGGGNITHWSFLNDSDNDHPNIAIERLCGKLFLVTDKDGAGLNAGGEPSLKANKKYERHVELEKNLGERYYCLQSKEIENTLAPHVLENTIREYESIKSNAGNLTFKAFEHNKYKNKAIGKFIESEVNGLKRSYAAESGTIKDKVNFAKKAVKYIESFDDLTDDAKALTKRIYKFIQENN